MNAAFGATVIVPVIEIPLAESSIMSDLISTSDALKKLSKEELKALQTEQTFTELQKSLAQEIKKGQVYFVIRDSDLVEVIKTCRSKKFKLGKDVGVLSYNDTPMKQIVGGGISVISTNFELMGEKAAEFVKYKQKIVEVLPTSLTLRESL